MNIDIEVITPQKAALYLQANTSNRPLRASRVAQLADALSRGEWQVNGDAIRFAKSGELLDGQHRLSACVRSGVSFQSVVVRGLQSETFTTIDTGVSRTAGDALALGGYKNATAAASVIRAYLVWKAEGRIRPYSHSSVPTVSQIMDFAEKHEIVHRAVSYVASTKFIKRFVSKSMGGFFYLAISDLSEDLAVQFLNEIEDPDVIVSTSATFKLRERLMEDAASKKKMSINDRSFLIMKAFRLWHSGAEVKILRVGTRGPRKESDKLILPIAKSSKDA